MKAWRQAGWTLTVQDTCCCLRHLASCCSAGVCWKPPQSTWRLEQRLSGIRQTKAFKSSRRNRSSSVLPLITGKNCKSGSTVWAEREKRRGCEIRRAMIREWSQIYYHLPHFPCNLSEIDMISRHEYEGNWQWQEKQKEWQYIFYFLLPDNQIGIRKTNP